MSFNTHSDASDDVMSEINVTPLVDVMLVLLVAFIVTAPLVTNAIQVNLPKTVTTQPAQPSQPTTVSVDASGLVFVDKEPVELGRLEEVLRQRHVRQPDLVLHLSSDEAVRYGTVAQVMAMIEKAGITRLAVLTATH